MREPGRRARLAQLIVASSWLGAAVLFVLSVAPAAFAALPSRELAGSVVGRVLPAVFWSGAVTGAILVMIELAGAPVPNRRTRMIAGVVITGSCLVAQLAIAPRIADVRATMNEPLASLAVDHPQRVAFGRLHMFSVAWLAVALIGAATAIGATAITLDRDDAP